MAVLSDGTIARFRQPKGPTHLVVIRGPRGRPGSGGGDAFEHTQVTPSASWSIAVPESFGRRPSVSVYDTSGIEIEADVTADSSIVNISFPAPTTGSAVLT